MNCPYSIARITLLLTNRTKKLKMGTVGNNKLIYVSIGGDRRFSGINFCP
jgi:hypothetical protein